TNVIRNAALAQIVDSTVTAANGTVDVQAFQSTVMDATLDSTIPSAGPNSTPDGTVNVHIGAPTVVSAAYAPTNATGPHGPNDVTHASNPAIAPPTYGRNATIPTTATARIANAVSQPRRGALLFPSCFAGSAIYRRSGVPGYVMAS
ncbi:MAG: hypothetical protein ABGY41_17080, partial [Candidatus Poribacteria bacterium]